MATISAGVQYAKRLKVFETEVPFQSFVEIPADAPDQRKTNLEFETKVEVFTNMRDRLGRYSLDEDGFMVKIEPLPFPPELFSQREKVESLYLPELERIAREMCEDIDRVYFFDWRVCAISALSL
jgi:hypothetical protein